MEKGTETSEGEDTMIRYDAVTSEASTLDTPQGICTVSGSRHGSGEDHMDGLTEFNNSQEHARHVQAPDEP